MQENNFQSESIENLSLVCKESSGIRLFETLVQAAYNGDHVAINRLGDGFSHGDFWKRDPVLAKYLHEIAKGNHPETIQQYRKDFTKPKETQNYLTSKEAEEIHLGEVLNVIQDRIIKLQQQLRTGESAYCLESDIQEDLYQKTLEIEQLSRMMNRPYYGRLDVTPGNSKEVDSYYIGEEVFYPYILSVWSDFGKHYRSKSEEVFQVGDVKYTVRLRREIDINNGKLIGIYDTYIDDGKTTVKEFDPFLHKVLQEKRGEANISNIIRSIQENQNRIIDFDFDKSFIVQGCAGSGKTMILLHRLANLKYNRPDTHWSEVKIITPNESFSTYLDAVSSGLNINMIKRCSLPEYYLLVLERYSTKLNGKYQASENKNTLEPDSDLSPEFVEWIYSNTFAKIFRRKIDEFRTEVEQQKENILRGPISLPFDEYGEQTSEIYGRLGQKKLSFSDLMKKIGNMIRSVVKESSYSTHVPRVENHQCFYYAEVLGFYLLLGAPPITDALLCIDEGQDISRLQYRLLQQINRKKVRFNIYGDINQKLSDTCGISDWEELQKFIEDNSENIRSKGEIPVFKLAENYRNSQEIVSFYDKSLNKADVALGLKIGRRVTYIKITELEALCKFHIVLHNRVLIVAKHVDIVPDEVRSMCVSGVIEKGKISLMDVLECKGLEFDVTFVLDYDMDNSERYIAYTRSLSELYIIS